MGQATPLQAVLKHLVLQQIQTVEKEHSQILTEINKCVVIAGNQQWYKQ